MIKRRSQRQQKQKAAKGQNESHPQSSGLKRNRVIEERGSKKHKASDNNCGGVRKRSIFEGMDSDRHKDSDDARDAMYNDIFQSQASGLKKPRVLEERSSKKHKVSDSTHAIGRKRNTFEEKSPNKHKDSDDAHDSYCWKCHNYCQDEKCSTCNRVYCFKCFKGQVNQICEACLLQNASEDAFSTIADTSSLLLSVIETSFPENKISNRRLFNWQPKATEVKLCHIVDFAYIDSKSKDTDGLQYRSPAELLNDVKWMYHNCVILYGEHHDITNEAREIMKQFTLEIEDLSDCAECYRKTFLNICETPHPLIMAKQKSYSPWPAKCLRVLDSKAHVRYFGSHQMAKVPLKDCCFVSKDDIDKKKSKSFEKSKKEFNKYITLFEETFGEKYPFLPKGTPFDVNEGQDLMNRMKEKYQRAQKTNRTSTTRRVIDLTDDDYRDSKVAVNVISEETGQSQLQHSDDSNNSTILNAVGSLDNANWGQIESLLSSFSNNPVPSGNLLNNFTSSGSRNNIFLPGPYNSQTRNTTLFLPYGSPNESGISISNVYSGSDPHSYPELDLNAQGTSFLINDSSHGIPAVPNFGIPQSCTSTEAENNSREDTDDDIQVVEELNSDTQRQGVNFKNIDEKLVQVILCRDPAAYSILKAANDLVRQLFVQFWGIANGIKNAPAILSAQQEKIKKLKKDKAELLSKCDDRVANADSILRSIYAMKCDTLKQKNKDLEEKLSKASKELEFYKNSLDRYHEAANDYKKNSYNQPPMTSTPVLEISKCSKTVEKITVEVIPKVINLQSQQPLF